MIARRFTEAASIDASTTGVKATYTVPAGKTWTVRYYALVEIVTAATLTLRLTVGGKAVIVESKATDTVRRECFIPLKAADTIVLEVESSGGGSEDWDTAVCIEETV